MGRNSDPKASVDSACVSKKRWLEIVVDLSEEDGVVLGC